MSLRNLIANNLSRNCGKRKGLELQWTTSYAMTMRALA